MVDKWYDLSIQDYDLSSASLMGKVDGSLVEYCFLILATV